ncbi:hypothetical protein ACFL5K_00010 [Gemmatimonadota bacterium]
MKLSSVSFSHISKFCLTMAGILFCQSGLAGRIYGVEPPVSNQVVYESGERQDILDEYSPDGLQVIQITSSPKMASHHVYPERPMFTPDSKRFIFHRMPAEGTSTGDYWICDIENNFSLRQVTDEREIRGMAVSPCGKWMYYCIEDTSQEGLLKLKRLSLEDYKRETIYILDGPIPGTNLKPSRVSLRSISSNGKRLCAQAFLGDGKTENAPFGILVFDIDKLSLKLIFKEKFFNNMHLQFCRSLDPIRSHDILIQHNHNWIVNLKGERIKKINDESTDLHVIRDDGAKWRDIPVGRDGIIFHHGHEQWRGRSGTVLSSVTNAVTGNIGIYEGWPIPTDENTSHMGSKIPGGRNNDLCRNVEHTSFDHFSVDLSGMHIVARSRRLLNGEGPTMYLGTISPGEYGYLKVQYLLNTKMDNSKRGWFRGQSDTPRPFFSPDASMAFFHSNLDGTAQIFMVTGYKLPAF